jgi:ribosomal protein S18 acetylase RimI-like enzyme
MSAVTDFEIVPMSLPFLEGFWSVLDVVAREGLWLELLEAPPIDVLKKLVSDDIVANNALFIAKTANTVVGWCAIIRETRPFRTHRGKLAMGVHPEFRSQGLGRRLLDQSIRHADEIGVWRIELSVYAYNPNAQKLYESAGFEVEGLHRMTRVFEGRYFDTIDMALLNHDLL